MLVAAFIGSALIWSFICVLAAIIVGAASHNPVGWWKRVLVGAIIGTLYGFAVLYLLVSLAAALGFLFTLLTPAPLDRYALAMVTTLLLAVATTLAAIGVGLLSDRSAAAMLRCAMVGAAFGLAVGIANAALRIVASSVALPVLEADGLFAEPGMYSALITAIQVIIDIALAIAAYRMLGRRRIAPQPADPAQS